MKLLVLLQPNNHDHGGEEVAERILAVSKDHIQVHHLNILSLRKLDLFINIFVSVVPFIFKLLCDSSC